MKRAILAFLLILIFTVSACSDKAKELYDTAQFEELQKNREHATQLYDEIVRKYPDSDYAKKSKERLTALQQEKQK